MATKRFCDMPGCGQEVTDYPITGFVSIGKTDFKVEISVMSVSDDPDAIDEPDLCQDCCWTLINGINKTPPTLKHAVNFSKAREKSST